MRHSFACCAVGLSLALGFASCGGSSGSAVTQRRLVFTVQPSNAVAGEPNNPAIVVELQDSNGRVISAETTTGVTLTMAAGGGVLSGTTSVVPQNGVATFGNVRIETAGAGYALRATSADATTVVSSTFDVAPGAPSALVFRDGARSGDIGVFQPFEVEVEIHDRFGNLVEAGSHEVSLSLGTNPGSLMLHNSGHADGLRILELVDPVTPAILELLSRDEPSAELQGMIHDPEFGVVWGTDGDQKFYAIDPATGVADVVGDPNGTLTNRYRGLVLDGSGSLLAATVFDNEIWTIDKATGTDSFVAEIAVVGGDPNDFIGSFNGFARHPLTGAYYAVAVINSRGRTERWLLSVDIGSGTATVIGQTERGMASLAFLPQGTLIGVTGDGGSPGETLYTIDPDSGAATEILTMGGGDRGESITTVPARLRGTVEADSVDGVASFGDLRLDAMGAGYTLVASANSLTSATSAAFNLGAPVPGGAVGFAVASQTVSEGIGTITVDVSISEVQQHDVFVDLICSEDSTAICAEGFGMPDVDFPEQATLVIPAGAVTAQRSIEIVNDTTVESDEVLILEIRSVGYGSVGTSLRHSITILDDD